MVARVLEVCRGIEKRRGPRKRRGERVEHEGGGLVVGTSLFALPRLVSLTRPLRAPLSVRRILSAEGNHLLVTLPTPHPTIGTLRPAAGSIDGERTKNQETTPRGGEGFDREGACTKYEN